MRLSEALLKGAKIRPQCMGQFFVMDQDGKVYACALGSIIEAFTGRVEHTTYNLPEDALKVLRTGAKCPACKALDSEAVSVQQIVAHLNDASHGWTREKIATDFLVPLGL